MDWADEGDLFESLVASERVGDWLAEACGAGAAARLPPSARLSAARALATEVSRGGAYAAEALAVCAEAALSAAAEAASGDSQPALADGLRSAAAACAKAQLAADGCSERVFALPCGASVRLREASCAGDVLGLRVWDSGPRLVAHLAQQQQLGELLGASVLELGAGVGLVGLSALLLGAGSVTLTDTAQAPGVLQLLTHNAALNTQPGSGTLARVAALDWADRNAAQQPSDVTTPPLEPGETFDIILASDVLCVHPPAPRMRAHVSDAPF
jgi:hypothetical protein